MKSTFVRHFNSKSQYIILSSFLILTGDIKDEESVPVFKNIEDSENGPYLELIPSRVTSIPKYILTKTHCGGFCASCSSPEAYIETPRSFLKSCLKGKRGVFSPEHNAMRTHTVHYSADLISKVVHIFRNPVDNVVARFHLERKRYTAKKHEKWLAAHPNNKEGFQASDCVLLSRLPHSIA